MFAGTNNRMLELLWFIGYLVGSALVITRDHCEYFNILNLAIDEACKLLGNPEWSTRTDY